MNDAPYEPRELTGAASLNHVVLGSIDMPEVQGWLAQDACSRGALQTLATDIGLSGLRPGHLADDLAAALSSGDPNSAQLASATLHTFGRRLGALIATLRDPATPARQADSPYRRSFLVHWLTVDSIWLAGGLLAGPCGPRIINALNSVASLAPHPCHVGILQQPELAPLIGAARQANPATVREAVAVADLGHSRIKTAVAERHAGTLAGLRRLATYGAPTSASADEVEGAVAAALIPAVEEATASGAAHVRLVISVASFIQNGLPADDGQGIYGSLARRTQALLHRIEVATGVTVDLRYLHDGTAAASASTTANSATITAGTWLGVGFLTTAGPPLLNIDQRPLSAESTADIYASAARSDGGLQ